jgi:predicted ATPase/DNA-binding CsgD family transcriptional regulator
LRGDHLSAPATTLIGREQSLAEAAAFLHRDDVRLLTITGPGGVGKTRLALEIGSAAGDQFTDGVVLVALQAVHDPGLVVGSIARSLGLFDAEGDLEQRLISHLVGRQLLLVVDNFEQVVEAAPSLGAIVAASPGLKAVVTSRTRLRIGGEQEFPLGPLEREDALSVFLERARAVRPDFLPDEAELAASAQICDHLDCLPLAVELAAARVKMLSPAGILARLEHPLELLTSGSRDAPARHRALRDTIGWSFELLGDVEQALFRRLSVFAGGCTLEAVENVCDGDLETIGSLVDESLVRSDGERFSMLETIREYAIETLNASSDANDVRRAHAAYYLGVVRAAAAGLATSDQALWRAGLEADHGNLRAAIRWSLDDGDTATALDICTFLAGFWLERGYLGEGRLLLDEALAAPVEPSPTRARALTANGVLSHYQGDYDRADELCGVALELSRSLGDQRGVAEAVTGLALVRRTRGDYREAESLFQEALSIYEGLGAEEGTARTLYRYGIALMLAGEADRARPLFDGSLELSRRFGDSTGVALGLQGLAFTRRAGADLEARMQIEESLDILRGLGDRRNVAKVLVVAADINADLGEAETAAGQLAESLTLFVEFGDRWLCGWSLEAAAQLAAAVGDSERAARLFGAADAVWVAIEAPLPAGLRDRHDRVLADVRSRLGVARFEAACDEGRSLPVGATIELVQPAPSPARVDTPEGLTTRELDVLTLVAEGRTDAQVAERLVVSLRTVHAHLRSIYRKLDVHTRSAATRYALEHGLVKQ